MKEGAKHLCYLATIMSFPLVLSPPLMVCIKCSSLSLRLSLRPPFVMHSIDFFFISIDIDIDINQREGDLKGNLATDHYLNSKDIRPSTLPASIQIKR